MWYNLLVSIICLKYRLIPTKIQISVLNRTLGICRDVYNSLIGERTFLRDTGNAPTGRYKQQANITAWKATHPELSEVHSQVLQNIVVRVDLVFQAFFRRVKAGETPGYPRFKGIGGYDSITFPQAPSGCRLLGNTLRVSKVGDVKCVVHRPLLGVPKTCTISRQSGKWFALFTCEYEPDPLPESNALIGIDVGLEKFASLSDGSFVENPRFFRRDEKALAKAGRRQAKTPKRSKQRKKTNKVLARIHERIRNRRHNFTHQLSRKIVNEYGLIAVEKLNVKGMVKNHNLAKSISDAAWTMFRTVLSYKAESAGRIFKEVNPAYTSQDCSGCGHRAKKTLKERWHNCPMCGLSLDRDTNAAFNILNTATGCRSVAGAFSIEAPPI